MKADVGAEADEKGVPETAAQRVQAEAAERGPGDHGEVGERVGDSAGGGLIATVRDRCVPWGREGNAQFFRKDHQEKAEYQVGPDEMGHDSCCWQEPVGAL